MSSHGSITSANAEPKPPATVDKRPPAEQAAVDMADARAATSFNPDKIYEALNEGMRDGAMRKRIADIVAKEPAFSKRGRAHMSRFERIENGLAITKRLLEMQDEHEWDYIECSLPFVVRADAADLEALSCTSELLGLYLHEVAFQPVIQSQGSDEQHEEWLERTQNHAIIGCYAQTELGHGSNVQKLETRATYVPETDEFEIHSPSVSAHKWWIGARA